MIDTDIFAAQSNPYRRMAANMYQTKEGKYYHIHGSLEATTTLNMIGLPGHQPDLRDYDDIVNVGSLGFETDLDHWRCRQEVYSPRT
jgi:hypothetical protein